MKLSLRAKGLLVFLALLAYMGVGGFALFQERHELLRLTGELEKVHAAEGALSDAGYAVAHSLVGLQEKFYSQQLNPSFADEVALDVEMVQSRLQRLAAYEPKAAKDIEQLDQNVARLRAGPSRDNLMSLHDAERDLNARLDEQLRQTRERRNGLWASYRGALDGMSVLASGMAVVGAIVFGALITTFLTRLAWDIRKLALRAAAIMKGYRGQALEVTRGDEVGSLMDVVNRMQSELREREQQLEFSRERRFHQEKMAAIGSLAAAVAHEINNPIASIAGIAQTMCDAAQSRGPGDRRLPEMILEQTGRIGIISRQIAELTEPRPREPELLDLNALVQNTCAFVRFDGRMHDVDIALDLGPHIRAVNAVADHLTQVLMNLLINAADAVEGLAGRKPEIRVSTRAGEKEVLMQVIDNGHGMDENVLARAFEEFFTTKPPDKGRGLGLFMCKALIEAGGGRIDLHSTPGVGTTAEVYLPLPQRSPG